jgi:CelD/BcsL family acetyltransferase involved in cellulose biosynthesis
MDIQAINPLKDPRWTELINRHPKASVFHTVEWLNALRSTYGYEPIVFTSSASDTWLANGLVSCDVRSWLTGHRLVSLPFSDYCEPLFDSAEELLLLVRYLQAASDKQKWSYIELRPVNGAFGEIARSEQFQSSGKYFLHRLDLGEETGSLFRNFDKDSVQRRIRHAERAGLTEEAGRSETLVRHFYDLLVTTRRRHHLPPQPYLWFQNLVNSFAQNLEIRVAYKANVPVAAILTLQFRDTVYYKYGCSDVRFNNLGATPLLLWRAIERAKSLDACKFDFGRTEIDNSGLLAFKDKWAPRSNPVVYLRFPHDGSNSDGRKMKVVKQVFAHMPEKLLTATGTFIYRHIG